MSVSIKVHSLFQCFDIYCININKKYVAVIVDLLVPVFHAQLVSKYRNKFKEIYR